MTGSLLVFISCWWHRKRPCGKTDYGCDPATSQVARDILEKVFSSYPVKNAWSRVSFGSNKDGIHRAAVDDPMHYNSSGLFSYLAEIVFGGLKPKEAEMLERYPCVKIAKSDCRFETSSQEESIHLDLPTALYSLPLRKLD